jgi:hypothetical protein
MTTNHSHCPYECEHPQPIRDQRDGKLYCGRCWIVDDQKVEMRACTPETCPGDTLE